MSCLQNFTTKEVLNSHREWCLLINETRPVKYETGIIKFKNYDKQITIPFKIYADTECLLKRINIEKGKHTKLYQKHIPSSKGAKLFVSLTNLLYQLKLLQLKTVWINLSNAFLSNKSIVIK